MTKHLTIFLTIGGAVLLAQTPEPKGNFAFQQIRVMGAPDTVGKEIFFQTFGSDGPGSPAVTGRPVSATEQHRSVQILGDGTRIENSDTDTFYRDDQGRTRTEHAESAGGQIVLHDPVAGYSMMLDPASKTAHKMVGPLIPKLPLPPPEGRPGAGAHSIAHTIIVTADASTNTGSNTVIKRSELQMPDPVVEDLGTETVNGVLAKGTRSTITIPAGQIGNDRPIQVVNERWQSPDLQMLVKSVNKDPRFGETTYELTNIDRSAPSAALFQVPSDYTVQESNDKPVYIEKHIQAPVK